MTLIYDAQQFTIYVGFILLIGGVIGNGMNILVFSRVRSYRTNPCTFYFLMGSIDNMFYILFNLTIRLLSVGYGIDVIGTSRTWCKIRQFFLYIPSLISVTYSCLAIIDQFLITSRSAYIRQCSKIQWAYRTAIIVLIFWCLYGIHVFFVFDILPISKSCSSDNAAFLLYIRIYLLGIICGIPVSIMVLFGWLTYRNIRQTTGLANLHCDRQLIQMTSIHVLLTAISLLPYGLFYAYTLITATVIKDSNQQLKEYFASTVVSMGTYLYYVGSCYAFIISSKRFRQNVKDQILCWRRRNEIRPQ